MPKELFFEKQNKERKLEQIISLNDNGKLLIELLKLKNLKASPENKKGDTRLLNAELGDNKSLDTAKYVFENYKNNNYKYKKYPLIDLGTNGNPYISILAQTMEVPGVVAVDIENQIDKSSLNLLKKSKEYVNKNFPVLGLKMDMLELLRQLPDDSCNVTLFSIDSLVLKLKPYQTEMFYQLHRIVPTEGVIISINSIIDHEKEYSDMFKPVYKDSAIFKKIPFNK